MNAEKLQELIELFGEAVLHLEYCGYGDSYERECAREDKLPQRLNAMLEYLKTMEVKSENVTP